MNGAADKIAREVAALSDIDLLKRVLGATGDDVTIAERDAFRDMLALILAGDREWLSKKQRSWAEEVARRIAPILAADVPRGREVPTPAVLQKFTEEATHETTTGGLNMPTSEEIDAQVADVTAELQKLLDVYAKELLAKFDKLARVAMHAIELARLVGQTHFRVHSRR